LLTVSEPAPDAFVQPVPVELRCNEKFVAEDGQENSRLVPDKMKLNFGGEFATTGSSVSAPDVRLESVSLRKEIWE
jgi:hypothetical protein